jgi:hypothetical protein
MKYCFFIKFIIREDGRLTFFLPPGGEKTAPIPNQKGAVAKPSSPLRGEILTCSNSNIVSRSASIRKPRRIMKLMKSIYSHEYIDIN